MGFERRGRQFTLQFEQEHYAGLEVVMGFLTTGQFLELTELATKVQDSNLSKAAAEVRKLFELVASRLTSWNLEDLGQSVPATMAGLLDQDFTFVMDIVTAWMDAIASVPLPLPSGSSSGGTFQEGSIPMTALSSPSQPS